MIRLMKIMILIFAIVFSTTGSASGDASAGEAVAANCSGCHGASGEGDANNPPLAGLDSTKHFEMLKAYKDGTREGAMMQMFVANLSEEDMKNVAAYYAALKKSE